jgi:hypothetical protein
MGRPEQQAIFGKDFIERKALDQVMVGCADRHGIGVVIPSATAARHNPMQAQPAPPPPLAWMLEASRNNTSIALALVDNLVEAIPVHGSMIPSLGIMSSVKFNTVAKLDIWTVWP